MSTIIAIIITAAISAAITFVLTKVFGQVELFKTQDELFEQQKLNDELKERNEQLFRMLDRSMKIKKSN